jgi:hypothetical protein
MDVTFTLTQGDSACVSSFQLPFSACTLDGTGSCATGSMECKYPDSTTSSLATVDLTGPFTVAGSTLTDPVMNGTVTNTEGAPLHCTYGATAALQ